jgi:hypothetical protein
LSIITASPQDRPRPYEWQPNLNAPEDIPVASTAASGSGGRFHSVSAAWSDQHGTPASPDRFEQLASEILAMLTILVEERRAATIPENTAAAIGPGSDILAGRSDAGMAVGEIDDQPPADILSDYFLTREDHASEAWAASAAATAEEEISFPDPAGAFARPVERLDPLSAAVPDHSDAAIDTGPDFTIAGSFGATAIAEIEARPALETPPNHARYRADQACDVQTGDVLAAATVTMTVPEDMPSAEPLALQEEPSAGVLVDHQARPEGIVPSARRETANVLHVGCGAYDREKLPAVFLQPDWREIRLDIDPEVGPDVVASITDMSVVSDGTIDAVYSSHNIEHLYPHEVPLALGEMHRVLNPAGFALIRLPDLQEVARHVAEGKLEEPLYISPMGAISPLDILYGHRASLESGNTFMAHRTGFTGHTLGSALIKAGFSAALVQRNTSAYSLTVVAFRNKPDEEQVAQAQALILPDPELPAVLYALTD